MSVVVEMPQHAGLAKTLSYACEAGALPPVPGQLVRVPLGTRTVTGVVWEDLTPEAEATGERELKPLAERLDGLPVLSLAWRQLVAFAASYYQRGLGEVALSALPPERRKTSASSLARRLARLRNSVTAAIGESSDKGEDTSSGAEPPPPDLPVLPALSEQQQLAVDALLPELGSRRGSTHLLFGATGSGKTEVYMRLTEAALQRNEQDLVLVPEINLTPQLEQRFAERFPGRSRVSLHSGLTAAQRANNWLMVHLGLADLVLGTRLAIFAPLPRLGLVIVDEEHDPSYKQQDGARYSARDLAVYRGSLERVPVILGSATPSLESWQRAAEGRYRRVDMPQRIGDGRMPELKRLDMRAQSQRPGGEAPVLAQSLLDAIEERRLRGEQSLLLLNRRGYAPVLHCGACAWKSQCKHCSAWRVFHKADRTLRCHHCGWSERVPKACPDCGNLDIAPLGRGTEKLAEQLASLLPNARIARIDADSTKAVGSLQTQLAAVHAGEVDVLVGTQMVTKGHDFRRVTLVAAVNPDSALFASDFRAGERLFALLLQAAGRAGRDAQMARRSQLWLQTWHPQHAVYAALAQHDFEAFAAHQLRERADAGLPPFSHLALLRADARDAESASAFLNEASQALRECALTQGLGDVTVYPPVPPAVSKVADVERMQMLLESRSRPALQRLLQASLPALLALKPRHRAVQRWAIDVDPLSI